MKSKNLLGGEGNSEIQERLKHYSELRFTYPWQNLEAALVQESSEDLCLIGYGSLLNPASAARTIANTPVEGHPPVVAWGVKRLFDYDMPIAAIERYGTGSDTGLHRAALNTCWSGDSSDVCNGRLIPLRISDIDGLREREKHYDLMPVVWGCWKQPLETLSLGFALCAPQDSSAIRKDILPFPPYLKVCMDGAALVSEEFKEFFMCTTYLADGETTLASI